MGTYADLYMMWRVIWVEEASGFALGQRWYIVKQLEYGIIGGFYMQDCSWWSSNVTFDQHVSNCELV